MLCTQFANVDELIRNVALTDCELTSGLDSLPLQTHGTFVRLSSVQ